MAVVKPGNEEVRLHDPWALSFFSTQTSKFPSSILKKLCCYLERKKNTNTSGLQGWVEYEEGAASSEETEI